MDSTPAFVILRTENSERIININHISAAYRIRAVDGMTGDVIPGKFFVRLFLLSGKELEIGGEAGASIYQVLEDMGLPLLENQGEGS